jgi:hypothetical protein
MLMHPCVKTSSPIITANWEVNPTQRWVVPVGGGAGKVVHFRKLPVDMYTQFFRNVERPDATAKLVGKTSGAVAISQKEKGITR